MKGKRQNVLFNIDVYNVTCGVESEAILEHVLQIIRETCK
jgi:hypothetical protein